MGCVSCESTDKLRNECVRELYGVKEGEKMNEGVLWGFEYKERMDVVNRNQSGRLKKKWIESVKSL